ncbi:MAG: hypothetical protein HY822_17440, partial [Acidobacteria bacterium]|nr:hypothetical protein [Acidobacteriota bacterium]
PGPGSFNVMITNWPAWRGILATAAAAMWSMIASMAGGAGIHVCATLPACRMGDTIVEALRPPNKIAKGEMTVMIGG